MLKEKENTAAKFLMPLLYIVSFMSILGVLSTKVNLKQLFSNFNNDRNNDKVYTAPIVGARPMDVATLVDDALAFKALLTTTQQSTLQQTYTTSLARKWSNLPCGSSCRNGIEFGDLSSTQLAAAMQIIEDALSSSDGDGYKEFMANRLAEAYLHANGGGNGYDTTLRWICFLNTPSATGAWMLQFGGHHYAANIAFNNGHVIGATPFFQGVEPVAFTWAGTSYAPLSDERTAFVTMLASLTSSELTSAKINATFSDCYMVPGETNGGASAFPTAKVGIMCNTLTSAQKTLVLATIKHYVNDMDSATSATVMALYTNEIDSTYIGFTGSATAGDSSTFLNANSNYVRIDGPSVWIEFVCQNGVVFTSQIHYHTVWRDRERDYGVDLTGSAIDGGSSSTSIQNISDNSLTVFPNPTDGVINLNLRKYEKNVVISVVNGLGQIVKKEVNLNGQSFVVNLSGYPAGIYFVKLYTSQSQLTKSFVKK